VKRGNLYRVRKPSSRDPKKSRVFVVVSRQVLIDSRFSTVISAPVYSTYDGLSTQVPVGTEDGLKHDSSIHCDELVSLPKSILTDFIGSLPYRKTRALNRALKVALEVDDYLEDL
jgi:mRNA interferase MazF